MVHIATRTLPSSVFCHRGQPTLSIRVTITFTNLKAPCLVLPHDKKAKDLKVPFEERVLKVLGEASSHGELWLLLHPPGDTSGDQQVVIEANLKGKARAREKVTLDYNGNLK